MGSRALGKLGSLANPVIKTTSGKTGSKVEGKGKERSAEAGGQEPPSRPNQMQKEVERGQAPKTIERVDKGVDRPGLKEKPHIHLEDGSALNNDGTWKHGGRTLTEAEKQWILKSGWKLPQ